MKEVKNNLKYGKKCIGQYVTDSQNNIAEIINMYTVKGNKCMVTMKYADGVLQDREKYFVSTGVFRKPSTFDLSEHLKNSKDKWKAVYGYEEYYMVSNLGNIISIQGRYKGQIINPINHRCGYKQIHMYKDQLRKAKFIHRIVVESFIRPLKKYEEVNHINGIKNDNKLCNLEITNRLDNNKKHISLSDDLQLSKEDITQIEKYCLDHSITTKEYMSIAIKSFKG